MTVPGRRIHWGRVVSRPQNALFFGVASIAAIGFFDYVTGREPSFSIFYLLPIGFATWYAGTRVGLVLSAAAALAWYGVDSAQSKYSADWIGYWNAAVRLGFFVLVSFLGGALRKARLQLRKALEARTTALEREVLEHRQTGMVLAEVEERYRQAQKLEAIGTLAAGVAHDFRNDLALIEGYCDLALAETTEAGTARDSLLEIGRASRRASRLTGQLLSFGRRELLRPRVVSVNRLVRSLEGPLEQMLGAGIRLVLDLDPSAGNVRVDPDSFEQAMLNLASNARDALGRGGRLRVATRATDLSGRDVDRHPGTRPGPYAVVSVADNGRGIPPEDLPRVFEPYFTTKGGRGTGLGLSVVHGFVAQSGGFIEVDGQVGRGTTFDLHFPRVDEAETGEGAVGPSAGADPLPKGNETLLVVEDNWALRDMTARLLTRLGYRVIPADPLQAESVAAGAGTIDLVLTDLVMPEIGGLELARRLVAVRPSMRVLYVSGYATELPARDHPTVPGGPLLRKPFGAEELARAVRDVLDARPAS